MNANQITVRVSEVLIGRLQAAAHRLGMTVSKYVRDVLENKLNRDQLDPKLPLTRGEFEEKMRPVIEELLIAIFGIEELIVRGFMDPIVSKDATEDTKVGVLKSAGANSRKKTKKLLEEN